MAPYSKELTLNDSELLRNVSKLDLILQSVMKSQISMKYTLTSQKQAEIFSNVLKQLLMIQWIKRSRKLKILYREG